MTTTVASLVTGTVENSMRPQLPNPVFERTVQQRASLACCPSVQFSR